MNGQKPKASLMAAPFAAAIFSFGISVGVLAQEASSPPEADPSPLATVSPDPSVVTVDYPLSGEVDASDAGLTNMPRTVAVEAGDLWFAPNEISISSDEPTVLVLVGTGQVAHNLIVDELGLQVHVGPGISSEVTLSDLPPGTYQFYCSIFGHQRAGMFGTLTIE